MTRCAQNPTRPPTGALRAAAPDPVAAFWLQMARHARTDSLRGVHEHLARQRAAFLAHRREQIAQEQHA